MLQFVDLCPDKSAFQKPYAAQVLKAPLHTAPIEELKNIFISVVPLQVKRCDEMARRLRYLQDQVLLSEMLDIGAACFMELSTAGAQG
jgi:hypothetical protein